MIARRLVAGSDAFALTSDQVAQAAGFTDRFACLPIEGLFDSFPVCCATRARWELSKPVLAFLSVMRHVPAGQYDADI